MFKGASPNIELPSTLTTLKIFPDPNYHVKRYYADIVAKIRNLLEENIVLVNSSSFTSVWLIEDSTMHGHWHDTSMSPEAVKEENALKELCSASGVELKKMNIPGKLRFDLCLEIKLTRDLSSTQQVVS